MVSILGFLYERLAAVATGLTNDVQSIKLQEFLRIDCPAVEPLCAVVIGTTLADVDKDSVVAVYAGHYLKMAMHFLRG